MWYEQVHLDFLATLAVLGLCNCVFGASHSAQPNIILIVADDLGWDDVGFHGSEIRTPNIDNFAKKGVALSNYYVSPICTPTRGSLLTGKHPISLGLQHYVIVGPQPYGLPLKHKTMAQYLKELGYSTHIVGKWHLGLFEKEYMPTYRGFDTHFGYLLGMEDYFDHFNHDVYWGLDFRRDMEVVRNETEHYSTELFTAEAEKVIEQHNTSKPLFLYLAHQAVHAGNHNDPLQAPQKYVDRFPYIKDYRRRIFAGMVSALDDSVGNITGLLQERGMLENSVIILTTDNGGPTNGYDGNAACNKPLRGVKNTLWEGGVRGTGFVYSPLIKKPGYVSSNLMHVSDWLPTLYHVAGGNSSDLINVEGVDLWDMISSSGKPVRKELLHNIDPIANHSAIRVGDYKLIMGDISGGRNDMWYSCTPPNSEPHDRTDKKTGVIHVDCGEKPLNYSINCQPSKSPCLFNVVSDPCEYNNIAGSNPQVVASLLKRLSDYAAHAVPPGNKPTDPRANPKYHDGAWGPWLP
ncbi:hypothetical protein ScPMuIL_012165 [Solemya velum]